MLNIFLGRVSLPEYKLTQPAKMEQIIVKEEVCIPGESYRKLQLTQDSDHSDQALRRRCYSAKCQVRPGSL
jgi:hypothetical protein